MSFTVYRSSAGSGKTYTLVKEYLNIVLKNPADFSSILAVTFTNKAANEMRERIITYLKHIAEPERHEDSVAVTSMVPELIKETGLSRESLNENASSVLHKILHNYQDFSVSTIDSFIHRVIRTFAFDLHLPLNFEVEVDAQSMVSMAVDQLLSNVGTEEIPTTILKKYTESRIDDEKNWDIEKDLKTFSKHLMKDDIAEFLPLLHSMKTDDLLDASKRINSWIRNFESEVNSKASSVKMRWDQHGIEAADLAYGNNGIWSYISRMANRDFSKLRPNKNVEKTLGDDKWISGKASDEKIQIIESIKDALIGLVAELDELTEINEGRYVFYKLLKRNIYHLAILNEIETVLSQIREAEGMIHISEFDKRISKVVDNEPVPFIYERLGERYKHFLIDEFQDTSVLEWQNILPLIENSLATAQFNMIVGDTKQAIYRFKGGEVDQLALLPKIYKRGIAPEMMSRERQLEHFYKSKNLAANYRSRKEVIDFNNGLYTHVSERLPASLKEFYKDCKQELMLDKPGGEVQISFIDAEGNKQDKEVFYFEKVLTVIREMIDEKGYSLRDIAILCRSNTDASTVARFLLMKGIEVISAESLLLCSSPEVNFIVQCLDLINNPKDKVARAGIINYLGRNSKNDQLHQNLYSSLPEKHSNDDTSWQRFKEHLHARGIDLSLEELNQMGLYERLEALINLFGLNKSPDPYVIFFMDVVFDYSSNKRFLPEDFTTYWRDHIKDYSIVVPEGMNAVNVMTIHKAKGLEFPVVIYPFANSEVKTSKDKKWIPVYDEALPGIKAALIPLTNDLEKTIYAEILHQEKEKTLLDLINILYVSTTRPTERLFIICDKEKAKQDKINNIPSILRSYLEDSGYWKEDENVFTFGDSASIPKKKTNEETVLSPASFLSGDWRNNIRLSGHAADYWDMEDEGKNIEWGKLVHNILSGIETVSDLEPAINKELTLGSISVEEAADLRTTLEEIMRREEILPFYDGRYLVKNETAIMTTDGKEFRPDRLMIKDEKAIVLDYKTGKEDDKHIRQLEGYARLLFDMGYSDVEKYLLYINDSCELLKV